MPGSFQVITRVLVRLINAHADFLGEADMFVDDVMGVCALADLDSCLAVAKTLMTQLLGSDAVEDRKTETGRALDWIGWRVNLDTMSLSVAKHNMLKTLYGFFSIDIESPVSLTELQSMASWASRYCLVCPYMRPHTNPLYGAMKPYGGRPYVRLPLPSAVKACVQLWRCCLTVLELYESRFARALTSFRDVHCDFVLDFDASLEGVGFIISRIDATGRESRWKCAQFALPYELTESKFQNSVEFIAIVSGMLALARLGIRDAAVRVRGDSVSALTWALKQNFKGASSRCAATVYTMLALHFNISVRDSEHVPGVLNVECDALSRFYRCPADMGFSTSDVVLQQSDTTLTRFLTLMDPTVSARFSTPESVEEFLCAVLRAVQWMD
jgi:hypothetical protein